MRMRLITLFLSLLNSVCGTSSTANSAANTVEGNDSSQRLGNNPTCKLNQEDGSSP